MYVLDYSTVCHMAERGVMMSHLNATYKAPNDLFGDWGEYIRWSWVLLGDGILALAFLHSKIGQFKVDTTLTDFIFRSITTVTKMLY